VPEFHLRCRRDSRMVMDATIIIGERPGRVKSELEIFFPRV
jgi:hypothetical protein